MADADLDLEDIVADDADPNWRDAREKMKSQAAALKQRDEELAALREEVRIGKVQTILRDAGIDPESDQAKALSAIDPDALQTAVSALKPAADETSEDEPPDPADVQMDDVRRAAASGAMPDAPVEFDVYKDGISEFEQDVGRGDSNEDAIAKWVSKVNFLGQSVDPAVRESVDARAFQSAAAMRSPVKHGRLRPTDQS